MVLYNASAKSVAAGVVPEVILVMVVSQRSLSSEMMRDCLSAVAKIVSTEGLVTIGYQDTMRNAVVDTRPFEDARVMATTTGIVVIVFNSGCRVTLKSGEVVNVSDASCMALVASRAGTVPVAEASPLATMDVVPTAIFGGVLIGIGAAASGNSQSGS